MTKKELENVIKDSLKQHDYNFETADREELLRVLNDIEQYDDTVCYDLISTDEWPIAIQSITTIKFKDKNWSIIVSFDMVIPSDEKEFVEIIWAEYQDALRIQKTFNL